MRRREEQKPLSCILALKAIFKGLLAKDILNSFWR
jgi:hypothetical protein